MPALTPQITLAGSLLDLSGVLDVNASLQLTLCGFGSLIPRLLNTGLMAPIKPLPVACPAGTYNFKVFGNDVIVPGPGTTYYSISVMDDRGAVIQTGAYQFAGTNAYDLANVNQYTPPPPPNPPQTPLVNGLLVTVNYSATPIFPAGTAGVTTFEIVLTGNVASSTVTGLVAGAIYNFIIVQDGAGAHTFAWPGICNDAPVISGAAGAITIQSYVARANGQLYPLGAGLIV